MFKRLFSRAPKVPVNDTKPLSWFDSGALNDTFNELQSAVKETSTLANSISTQLENRLHTTEQQLSTILYVITEGIIITDQRGIISQWNTGAEIIFGYSQEETIGRHIALIVKGDDHKTSIKNKFNQADFSDQGNVNRIKQLLCHHKDGRELLVELSVNVFPNDSSGKHGLIAIIRDITTQHNLMVEHEKDRKLMHAVLDSITDVVMVKDADGKWILANKAAVDLYNFTSEETYIGRTDEQIATTYPEFADGLNEGMATDAAAWQNNRTTRSEEVFTDRLNQKMFFDVLKTPLFTSDKQRDMLVVAARNVTSIKEKREHMLVAYKALNASSDIVCITDNIGKIVFANKMFLIKYRFMDVRDVLGKEMSIIRSSHTTDEQVVRLWATIKSGKVWEEIMVNLDQNGKEITVESTIIPIIDQELEAAYYINIQKCIDC